MRPILILVLAAALPGAGCGPKPLALREPDEFDAIVANPPMGCGSDENWRTFDDRELTGFTVVDDTLAPAFLDPVKDGATVPAAPAPTLAWQPTPTQAGKPNGDATCMECPACGLLSTDHLPPVSGDVYDLQFSVGGVTVYRIIYTSQRWTPPAALWSSWRGQTVSVNAFRMQLKTNTALNGPYTTAKPIHFAVGS